MASPREGHVLLADSGGHFEIICRRCGERSQDVAAFCGGCGAFLEWDGERVSSAPATIPDSVSVAAMPAADAAPAAVKPAMPIHRPPPMGERTVPRRVRPGDLMCSKCGEGNESIRKFCRRCGTTLGQSVTLVIPWWRRVLAPRPQTFLVAGSRPALPAPRGGAIQWRRALVKLFILALVVIVVVFAAVPSLRKHVTNEATSIRRSVHPNYPQIALQSATATNVGACSAPRLKDNSTVYWYTHPAAGPLQVLTVTLSTDFTGNVDKVGITPLAPDAPPVAGSALPYPTQLGLRAGGSPLAPNITLANPPKFRSFTIKAIRPPTIEMSALSTDPGAPANGCAEIAVIFYDRT